MYRTVSSLACFFGISFEDLIEEVPLSLLQYASEQSNYVKPCIGRDWELQQLQHLYVLSKNTQKTVSITGMHGIGKTNLIQSFIAKVKNTNNESLYFSFKEEENTLNRLCRMMLGLEIGVTDEFIRSSFTFLFSFELEYFYFLLLLGCKLNQYECQVLKNITHEKIEAVECLVLSFLIDKCISRGVLIIAIDDIDCINKSNTRIIKKLIKNDFGFPFFLMLGFSDVKQYSHFPDWLENHHSIKLRMLDEGSLLSLANFFVSTPPFSLATSYQHKLQSVKRSKGHPGILEELLLTDKPNDDFPKSVYEKISMILKSLPIEQRQILKFLAHTGSSVSFALIDVFLSTKQLFGVAQLNDLVCLGLLYLRADGYAFRHSVILEIVKEIIDVS